MNIVDIDSSDLKVGMDVTAWWRRPLGSGQGGIVTEITPLFVVLASGTDRNRNVIGLDEVEHWTVEEAYGADECLNYSEERGDCRGPVEDWWAGGSRSWPRCTFHGERRLESYENSMERYADSDVEPEWFDASYAGERWDDD